MSLEDSPYSLLVVDDQVTNVHLLSRFLSEYHVHTASNGAEAIEKTRDLLPDLILLDINMPDLDGYQVCDCLKNSSATCDIPIIFITGLSEPSQINKGFQLGAVDYITKPFSLSEVRARVRNHLALKTAKQSLKTKNLLLEKKIEEQTISSELARRVLQFVNRMPARYTDLNDTLSMFVHVISRPCHDEGGDHSFVQTLPPSDSHPARTLISIKDQSGHSVNCILRSIVSDLAHHSILRKFPGITVEESVSRLNNAVLQGGIFEEDDFFTSVTAALDHGTLRLTYLSAGHPSFIVIRGQDIFVLPERDGEGGNLPIAFTDDVVYRSSSIALLEGDKILFFTDGLTDMPLDTVASVLSQDDLLTCIREIVKRTDLSVSCLMNELICELQGRCTRANGREIIQFPDDITLMGIEIESTMSPAEVLHVKPSDYDDIDSCISFILTILSDALAERRILLDTNELVIPVSESVLNSWRHGHSKDPEKEIGIQWWFGNDFNVEIISQGEGFDYHHYINPIAVPNLTKQSGRGIFLIKKGCDSVRWRKGGKNIILSFALCYSVWENLLKHKPVTLKPFDLW